MSACYFLMLSYQHTSVLIGRAWHVLSTIIFFPSGFSSIMLNSSDKCRLREQASCKWNWIEISLMWKMRIRTVQNTAKYHFSRSAIAVSYWYIQNSTTRKILMQAGLWYKWQFFYWKIKKLSESIFYMSNMPYFFISACSPDSCFLNNRGLLV